VFFKRKGKKRLAKMTYRGCYSTVLYALQNLDMSVVENKKALRPLFWRTLFRLILSLDLRAGVLILATNRTLWKFAKKARDKLKIPRA
jgi:hypothetical protein